MELCKICKEDTWQALLKYPVRILKTMSNIDAWDICLDCMVKHCTSTNCLSCSYSKYPNCIFLGMKKHYMEKPVQKQSVCKHSADENNKDSAERLANIRGVV